MGSTKTSKNATEDVVRVCMQMLEPGEQYVSKPDQASEDGQILSTSVHEEMLVIKPLTLPSECKLEGFLTLFDDFALRPIIALKPNETPKWQHFLINNVETYKALWTRYWFRVEIIDDPNQELINKNVRSLQIPNTEGGTTNIRQQTIVLRYWQYPEHAEKEQEVYNQFSNYINNLRLTMRLKSKLASFKIIELGMTSPHISLHQPIILLQAKFCLYIFYLYFVLKFFLIFIKKNIYRFLLNYLLYWHTWQKYNTEHIIIIIYN